MVKHFFTKAKVSKLQNYRGQMVEKRLDLRCELWGETNMVKEKVVKVKREGGKREGETKVVSWEVGLDEMRRMW